MRKVLFRLAAIADVVLTLAACADSPTQSAPSRQTLPLPPRMNR